MSWFSKALIAVLLTQGASLGESLEITVEVDIFSGRPNPTWKMNAVEAERVIRMLAQMPRSSPDSFADRLGYRGILLHVPNATWRLFDGRAFESSSGQGAIDGGRRLERLTIESGKTKIGPKLYRTVLEASGLRSGRNGGRK